MWRFLAGMMSALFLATAGLLYWQSAGNQVVALPAAPAPESDAPVALADLPEPPSASPKNKEEKRFNRYDKDKNGAVSRDEYLLSRRKAYAKMDVNGDGVLQFAEYAAKATTKFAKADTDRTGALTRTEFATTRVVRKQQRKPACPPSLRVPPALQTDQEETSDEA